MVRHFVALTLALCLSLSAQGQQWTASRYFRDAATAVHWRPWGRTTFEVAKDANRPILLSIGYSSSWDCFLWHRDVFPKDSVAGPLNAYFVPVLVDRLEHPEVAEVFDAVQRSMTGAVTTPSHFVLTPRLEPVAVHTDQATFDAFLAFTASRWATEPAQMLATGASNLAEARKLGEPRAPSAVDATTLDAAMAKVTEGFDPAAPQPMAASFALRYAERTGNKAVRAAALESLRTFARTRARDQVGGGFHRRPDALEKFLTDQALMSMTYLEAWQVAREPEFENVVRTTLDYVLRDLAAESVRLARERGRDRGAAGFETSQHAYSLVPRDGRPVFVEDEFYLWSKAEVKMLLGENAPKAYRAFGLEREAGNLPVKADALEPALLQKLLDYRQKRPEPFRENTVLAGPNGLMISALARAGAALGEQRYRDAAVHAARLVTAKLWDAKKKVLHRSDAATVPVVSALGEDYAWLVQGLLDLFEATYDVKWLELARALQLRQDELFWNASLGRYATGSSLPDDLRPVLSEDDLGTPSLNAVSAMNLLRLTMLQPNQTWREHGAMMFEAMGGRLRDRGARSPQLESAFAASLATPRIVVVTGDPRKKETHELLRSIHERWEPLRMVLFVPEKGLIRDRITAALPFTAALAPDPEVPLAYVCESGECRRR